MEGSASALWAPKPHFTYTSQENGTDLRVVNERIRITTFNAAMLPSGVNMAQQGLSMVSGWLQSFKEIQGPSKHILSAPSLRAGSMAETLAATDSDILLGQEVFDAGATETLVETLKKTHHVVHHVGKGVVANSGLFFASRFPIDEKNIRFWPYNNLASECAFTGKGVLCVPTTMAFNGQPKKVFFFTTHTVAHEQNAKARANELQSVLHVMQETQRENPKAILFLGGDLNVTDFEPGPLSDETETIQTGEYTNLRSSVFNHFHDFYLVDHEEDCRRKEDFNLPSFASHPEPTGSFHQMESKAFCQRAIVDRCRYDYLLLLKEGPAVTEAIVSLSAFVPLLPQDNSLPLTDHLTLMTEIESDTLFVTKVIEETGEKH